MPFFAGRGDKDMISKIVEVMGKAGLLAFPKKYGIAVEPIMKGVIGRGERKRWRSFMTDEARYDHMERTTAADALEQPDFGAAKRMGAAEAEAE